MTTVDPKDCPEPLRERLAAAEALLREARDEIEACIALTGGSGRGPWLVVDRIDALLSKEGNR